MPLADQFPAPPGQYLCPHSKVHTGVGQLGPLGQVPEEEEGMPSRSALCSGIPC